MFFRNEKPKVPSFEERIAGLKEFGFASKSESAGRSLVTRGGCAAVVEDLGAGKVAIGKAGVLVGGEIALLIHGGYQMFLRTPSGKEVPALAPHLKDAARLRRRPARGPGFNRSLQPCARHCL